MRIATCGALLLVAGACCVRAQQAGMQNDWDVHKTLAAIALHAERLAPFVDQIHPENWSGAPEAYAGQAKACRDEVRGIAAAARVLSQNPEKLTEELQLLFRIRTLEGRLASLGEGLRKYRNPPMADMLKRRRRGKCRQSATPRAIRAGALRRQGSGIPCGRPGSAACRQSLSRQPRQEKD